LRHILWWIAVGADIAMIPIWLGFAVYYGVTRPRRQVVRRHARHVLVRGGVGLLLFAFVVFRPRWLLGPDGAFTRSWFYALPVAIAGLLLVAGGATLAVWARVNLGSMWSGRAEVGEGHRLIQHGAFAITRHPIYTGIFSMLFGTFLVTGAPGWLGLALLALSYHAWVASIEDRLMKDHFGQEWLEYRTRVGSILDLTGRTAWPEGRR
jgi:protein-S-isoprenylcysteine O-methyltransferase Ste14